MDADIQFGELEESGPERHLRPDRNKQFAVASYDEPREGDLPIFVDLDVMRDMEAHAQSDTSVELGGVLLGGQFEDENGEPFVMVTDSLRAEHFEATKGSFKFTHDTWEKITREREDFPEDLQMVGWYHTHPDWGVFLSGMDMFICDNFFNKPLDVALVIDPCRGDRGMFQWTGNPQERVRRTRGFYLICSRFRRDELEYSCAVLEGRIDMAAESRFQSGAGFPVSPPPVINITQPPSGPQNLAVLSLMTVQLIVLAMIAWRFLAAPTASPPTAEQTKQVAELEKRLDSIESRRAEANRVEAQMQVLREVMGNLSNEPALVKSLEDLRLEKDRLESQAYDRVAAEKANRAEQARLEALLARSKSDRDLLREDLDEGKKKLAKANASFDELAKEKKILEQKLGDLQASQGGSLLAGSQLYWVIGAGIAVLVLGGGAAALFFRRDESAVEMTENDKVADESTNNQDGVHTESSKPGAADQPPPSPKDPAV